MTQLIDYHANKRIQFHPASTRPKPSAMLSSVSHFSLSPYARAHTCMHAHTHILNTFWLFTPMLAHPYSYPQNANKFLDWEGETKVTDFLYMCLNSRGVTSWIMEVFCKSNGLEVIILSQLCSQLVMKAFSEISPSFCKTTKLN